MFLEPKLDPLLTRAMQQVEEEEEEEEAEEGVYRLQGRPTAPQPSTSGRTFPPVQSHRSSEDFTRTFVTPSPDDKVH